MSAKTGIDRHSTAEGEEDTLMYEDTALMRTGSKFYLLTVFLTREAAKWTEHTVSRTTQADVPCPLGQEQRSGFILLNLGW